MNDEEGRRKINARREYKQRPNRISQNWEFVGVPRRGDWGGAGLAGAGRGGLGPKGVWDQDGCPVGGDEKQRLLSFARIIDTFVRRVCVSRQSSTGPPAGVRDVTINHLQPFFLYFGSLFQRSDISVTISFLLYTLHRFSSLQHFFHYLLLSPVCSFA